MESQPSTKDKTVGLLNNYHAINQTACNVPVKEEVAFAQTGGELKTKKD